MINSDPRLELIVGTMFSGKTTELIKRTNRYDVAGIKNQLFKPILDNRYSIADIKSHDQLGKKAIPVKNVEEMRQYIEKNTEVIGIDEIQFFDSSVIELCGYLVEQGKIVIAGGLLKDFADRYFPFQKSRENMADLLRVADTVIHLTAVCNYETNGSENKKCGREASRVQRFVDGKVAPLDSSIIKVGGAEAYAPRCRQHYKPY